MALQISVRAGEWTKLPSIPDAEGFAGAFAGVSNGALLVAGGANIVGDRWGASLNKVWYDHVYAISSPSGYWRKVGRLPKRNGYGISVTTPDGVLCIGGGDDQRNFAECRLMQFDGKTVQFTNYPPLPRPCALMCGALVGSRVFVFGGVERPDSTSASNTLWSLDLSRLDDGWRELPPCPGPGRILAVASAGSDTLYLFSGAGLSKGPDGKAAREYLRDAWSYSDQKGWQRLPDLPRAVVAAPSPAPMVDGRIYIFSGDDGANVNFQPVEKHPGFPKETLILNVHEGSWKSEPGLPFSRATVPVVEWQGRFVVPNGEVRPRVRTPEVWSISLK